MNTRGRTKDNEAKVNKAMDDLAEQKRNAAIEIKKINETLSEQLALSFMGNLEAPRRVLSLKSRRAKLQDFLSDYELTRKGLGALLP